MRVCIVDTRLQSEQPLSQRIANALRTLSPEATIEPVHLFEFTAERLKRHGSDAVILSGQGTPWDEYPEASINRFFSELQRVCQPVLGICGGHQLIGLCYGAVVAPIRQRNPLRTGYAGCAREGGFKRIRVIAADESILKGLKKSLVVYESHYDELKSLPANAVQLCKGKVSRIQAFKLIDRPVFGVQFHPECYSRIFPDGKRVMENFLECVMTQKSIHIH